MSNRACESIMESKNESKIPEWAWDLGQWAWGRDWDQEMKSELRQWGKGEILSEWPWVREWERKDEEWENEKGRELCRLRGNIVFCLFKVSSNFKMLSFVFCIYLFFTRISTWSNASFILIWPVSTNTIRFDPNWCEFANKKKRTRHWHSCSGVNCHIACPCMSGAGVVALELHPCFLGLYIRFWTICS